jgi:hypothetical protein
MKKIITIFAIATSCSFVSAQTIVNGDFTSNNDANTFSGWSGSGSIGTINGAAATVSGYIKQIEGPPRCIAFDKGTGKCLSYMPGAPIVVSVTEILSQAISLTSLPEKLTGNYTFFGSLTQYSGRIEVTGTFDGKNLSGSLQTTSTSGTTPFEINIVPSACDYIKGSSKPCFFNSNSITINLKSCDQCPESITPNERTDLTVDDLALSLPTGIEDERMNGSKAIYPNPAKDILHVSGSAEIFDLIGNKVASGTNEINIEDLLSGIYVVKANGRSQKIVKE